MCLYRCWEHALGGYILFCYDILYTYRINQYHSVLAGQVPQRHLTWGSAFVASSSHLVVRSLQPMTALEPSMCRLNSAYCVDATRAGNMAHLLNHSCDPNCYSRTITVKHPVTGKVDDHVIIFAKVRTPMRVLLVMVAVPPGSVGVLWHFLPCSTHL